MADPGKGTQAEIRYQVQIQGGPCKFSISGSEYVIASGSDVVVMVRTVWSDGFRMDEKIVGVIGGEWASDCVEFIRIRKFMNQGGVIGLHRDLVD